MTIRSIARMAYVITSEVGVKGGGDRKGSINGQTADRLFEADEGSPKTACGLSQEDLARLLGVSCAKDNRREKGQTKPSRLARAKFDAFCTKMTEEGSLRLIEGGAK